MIISDDLNTAHDLAKKTETYIRALRPILKSMEDTHGLLRSGILKESLIIYNSFKGFEGLGIEGVEDAIQELKVLLCVQD